MKAISPWPRNDCNLSKTHVQKMVGRSQKKWGATFVVRAACQCKIKISRKCIWMYCTLFKICEMPIPTAMFFSVRRRIRSEGVWSLVADCRAACRTETAQYWLQTVGATHGRVAVSYEQKYGIVTVIKDRVYIKLQTLMRYSVFTKIPAKKRYGIPPPPIQSCWYAVCLGAEADAP